MCLILIAHQLTEHMPLLVLANRDEFYNRPTEAAKCWVDCPELIAGRDLVSEGTWFGARNNRWATVTNIREGVKDPQHHSYKSRGWLVRDYLQGELPPKEFLAGITAAKKAYAGFNLLVGEGPELWYTSNRQATARSLPPGVYGLSNHLLDTPWPKVVRGKQNLAALIKSSAFNRESAFALLAATDRAADEELPDTGIPLEWERALSATFIKMPKYGTRCSTLLLARANGQRQLVERRYTDGPHEWQESEFSWQSIGKFS